MCKENFRNASVKKGSKCVLSRMEKLVARAGRYSNRLKEMEAAICERRPSEDRPRVRP
jgi:hypothetical protein